MEKNCAPVEGKKDGESEEQHGDHDSQRARRLLRTAVYFFAFFVFGWVIGQRGAVFLDLLLITDTDVTLGSLLFTMAGLASVAGAIIGGFVLDAVGRPLLIMASAMLLNAVLNGTIPLCTPLPLMMTLYFLSHFFLSNVDVVVNAELSKLWPNGGGSSLQGLHFCFAVGAILSPLATQPFIAPRSDHHHGKFDSDASTVADLRNCSRFSDNRILLIPGNGTGTENASAVEDFNQTSFESCSEPYVGETRVIYAFLMSAILCLISGVLLWLLALFPVSYARQSGETTKRESESSGGVRLWLTAAIVFVGVYNSFGCSIEDVLPHYLMTFVTRELDWSKTAGAQVTSVYWVGLAVGRLSGVGLVRVLSAAKIIVCCLLSLLVSLSALLLASLFHAHWAVWVSAAAVGLSVAVLFPTGLSYTHQRVSHLTGRLAALIFTTPMCAAMVIPLLLAHLMTRYDDMWYVYLFMAQTGLAMTSFAILHVLSSKLHRARQSAMIVYVDGPEDKAECSESFLQNSAV